MSNYPDYGTPQNMPNWSPPEPTQVAPLPPWVPGQNPMAPDLAPSFQVPPAEQSPAVTEVGR
jgi:hypothetical protein